MDKKIVCTSGFFNPVHYGHIEILKLAKELGDYLLVFVDSDNKAIKKKGYSFMPEKERLEIIKSIKYVDEAIIVDCSVSEALEKYKPHIFAKGGDRDILNLPQSELDVCKKYNIEIITGLGDKIQASSDLIDNIGKVNKQWGYYKVLEFGKDYKVKKLVIKPHQAISLQSHELRSEHWDLVKGKALITVENNRFTLIPFQSIDIKKGQIHRIENPFEEDLIIIEIQRGICEEDDIIRYEDMYNRV